MTVDDSLTGNPSGPHRALGALWIVYAVLRAIVGIALILWSATATLMFGALLSRAADPFSLMSEFHIVYIGLIVLSFICALLGLLAGLALLAGQGSARNLAILAAFFSVSEIPFGTTLGIYTLVVFLSRARNSR
jgi:hypothetical protein